MTEIIRPLSEGIAHSEQCFLTTIADDDVI